MLDVAGRRPWGSRAWQEGKRRAGHACEREKNDQPEGFLTSLIRGFDYQFQIIYIVL